MPEGGITGSNKEKDPSVARNLQEIALVGPGAYLCRNGAEDIDERCQDGTRPEDPVDQARAEADLAGDRRPAGLFADLDLRRVPRPDVDDGGDRREAGMLFGLDAEEVALLQAIPYRGSLPGAVRPTR